MTKTSKLLLLGGVGMAALLALLQCGLEEKTVTDKPETTVVIKSCVVQDAAKQVTVSCPDGSSAVIPKPAGERGEPGDVGAAGPAGKDGEPGAAGAAGAAGEKGDQGDQGEQGPAGETGAQGDQGPAGVKGDTGAPGAKGDRGDQGPAGEQGDKGDKGDVGEQGPQGERGETGATGPAGPAGATGATGPQGDRGDKGDTGSAGPTGPAGPAGERGETGAAGAAGQDAEPCTVVQEDEGARIECPDGSFAEIKNGTSVEVVVEPVDLGLFCSKKVRLFRVDTLVYAVISSSGVLTRVLPATPLDVKLRSHTYCRILVDTHANITTSEVRK